MIVVADSSPLIVLVITGTVAILVHAAENKLLDLSEAFARIKQTDFWIPAKLLDAELERFRQQERHQKQLTETRPGRRLTTTTPRRESAEMPGERMRPRVLVLGASPKPYTQRKYIRESPGI